MVRWEAMVAPGRHNMVVLKEILDDFGVSGVPRAALKSPEVP